jgi:predicted enzyme related to lactoylglutathione lyase
MTTATSTLLGRPIWYELMTTDMKGAESFYKTVVGWTTEPFKESKEPYTILNRSGNVGVGGMMTKPAEVKAPPFWGMYIGVPKLEDTVAQITRLGGKTHTEMMSIPNVGRMQLMMDPQGAAFYIMEPARSEQRPEGAPEIGDASWIELMTTDMNDVPDGDRVLNAMDPQGAAFGLHSKKAK